MKDVFVITEITGGGWDSEIIGIFKTREMAKEALAKRLSEKIPDTECSLSYKFVNAKLATVYYISGLRYQLSYEISSKAFNVIF